MTVDRVEPENLITLAFGGIVLLYTGMFAVFMFTAFFLRNHWGSALILVAGFVGLCLTIYWIARRYNETSLFRNTWVWTEGTVDGRMCEEHSSSYGDSVEYYLFFSFTAGELSVCAGDQSVAGIRTRLKALVSHKIYALASEGQSIGVRYAPSKAKIALLEGEW